MFFNDDPEITKHGYYIANGIKTLSKFEAYQLAGKDMSKVQFIFNDDVFDTYDWSVEPEEDIYELYRQRAEQLRKDYDYLVLIYSGGIDSHTVLETFLQNNIKLDEICTFANTELGSTDKKFNQEIFNAAIPFIKSLDLKKIGTHFRYVEVGKLIVDQISDEYHYETFEHHGITTSFWKAAVSSYRLKESITDHMNLVSQGKKVCYIWGHDKPSLKLNNNQYCLAVSSIFSGFNIRQYSNRVDFKNKFNNFYDEAFYICRESPKISIKQGHMLVNLMKTMSANDTRIKPPHEITIWGPWVEYDTNRWLSKHTVDSCIYPKAIMAMFKDDKLYRGSQIFSKKDSWFYESNHENKNKFHQKIQTLIKENESYFAYRPVDPNDPDGKKFLFAGKHVYSKFYVIGQK